MPIQKIYSGAGNVIEVGQAVTVNNTINKITNIFQSPRKRNSIRFNVCLPEHKFTGRKTELQLLDGALQRNHNPPDNIESLITVVSGLGGIGKTQLVREYVNQNASRYDDNVIWINGDREESIIKTFRQLANDTLNISPVGADGTEKNILSVVQDVYDYFCGKNFLFVFDNVESMDCMRKFLLLGPSTPNTRPFILITSRVQDWHAGIEVIRLGEWEQSEAIDFVTTILPNARENDTDIKLLVEDLQYFPLALRQATSYILHKQDTIRNYRVKYEKQKKQLLDSELFQNSVSKYTKTTFTTWNITIESIEQDTEFGSLAIKILRTMAYFHADNIHRASLITLTDGAKQSTGRGLKKYFIQLVMSEVLGFPTLSTLSPTTKKNKETLPDDKEELLECAVKLLIKYSMITSQERQSILSIHRVVQDVIKVTLKLNGQEKNVLRNALVLIEKLMKRALHTTHAISVFQHSLEYPDLVREFSGLPNTILMNLITNAMKEDVATFVNQFLKKFEKIVGLNHPILEKITFHLRYVKAYNYSRSLMCNDSGYLIYEQFHKMRAKEFGQDDVDTMMAKFEIGKIFLRMGNVSQAFTIFEEVSQQMEISLGYEHPKTIASQEIIAVSYKQTGLHSEALQRLNVIYEKKKSLFGEGHTKSLFTLNGIGRVLFDQEKYTQALVVFQSVCHNYVELGEDHATRFSAMIYMAHAYTKLGNYDVAIETFKNVHERVVKKFGENHRDTLGTLADFGVILLDQGNAGDSIEMFQKILTSSVEQDDEFVLMVMKNLGLAYARLGYFEQADKTYNDILAKRIQFGGRNHPDSLLALNDIGELYLIQEKYSDALPIFEEIYTNRIELGAENAVILTSMINIAFIYSLAGNMEESLHLCKQVHMHRTQRLGENHPDTLDVLLEIARILEKMGNHTDDALLIYESICEKRIELGEDSLTVRVAFNRIARAYGRSGKFTEALQILKKIHTKSTELGDGHPSTLCALIEIGLLYIDQNNYTEALETFYCVYERAKRISQNNELVVKSMRQLVLCHLQLRNYLQSWQLYREGLTRNIEILYGNPQETVSEYINTASILSDRGNSTEAFLIVMDMYVHRNLVGIANEDEIICGVKNKLTHLYDKLRSIRFIQKHLM